MLRVIDFRSGDKDDDSDGALFQTDSKTLSVSRLALAWHAFPLLMKPIGRGELIFKEFVLEGVIGGFWWTSGSYGPFKGQLFQFFRGPCHIVSGQTDTKGAFNWTLTELFYCGIDCRLP